MERIGRRGEAALQGGRAPGSGQCINQSRGASPPQAARYLNRLANLQLMDTVANAVKDANFSGTTRRALEERERLLAGCDISTEAGFKKHLDALRVHVITVSEIGAKDGLFHGEKYF